MNIEQARFNMIEQQIRPWDVLDTRVLELLGRVRREDFVPARFRDLAYADTEIALSHGEYALAPKVQARILQALQVQSGESVLEVGTGSGYLTALFDHAGARITSVDIHPEFTQATQAAFSGCGIKNVRFETGNAATGWGDGSYDAIALTGSLPLMPESWPYQLNIGGRLFVVVGSAPAMKAWLITRVGPADFSREDLFETVIPPLHHAPATTHFHL